MVAAVVSKIVNIRKQDGEYRVPGPNDTEAQAYYTTDMVDALDTARMVWGKSATIHVNGKPAGEPWGKNPAAISEAAAWNTVRTLVAMVIREDVVLNPRQNEALAQLDGLARQMGTQLKGGLHKNPALVIYNPVTRPVSGIIGTALQIKYEYGGKGYVHDFEQKAKVLAIQGPKPMQRRDLLIASDDGRSPLWADQAEVDAGMVRT